MKKIFIAAALALMSITSCTKTPAPGSTTDENSYINASDSELWQYYSFSQNEVIGSGSDADNETWFGRNDWDIAISRYSIRTNSGAATTIGSEGGVYTFDQSTEYGQITSVPAGAEFATDKEVTSQGMGGTTTTVKSEATVILFKLNEDGSKVMPPVYLQAPAYIFRSADGSRYYKVLFTQYQNENSESGHVKFKWAEIE